MLYPPLLMSQEASFNTIPQNALTPLLVHNVSTLCSCSMFVQLSQYPYVCPCQHHLRLKIPRGQGPSLFNSFCTVPRIEPCTDRCLKNAFDDDWHHSQGLWATAILAHGTWQYIGALWPVPQDIRI